MHSCFYSQSSVTTENRNIPVRTGYLYVLNTTGNGRLTAGGGGGDSPGGGGGDLTGGGGGDSPGGGGGDFCVP